MEFEYIGKIVEINNYDLFAYSHAMIPTPLQIDFDVCRIYFSSQCINGIARPRYVDFNMKTLKIESDISEALLQLGQPGSFDDNGILVCSVVKISDESIYMYYAGFELGVKVRYKLFTGLAKSNDGGMTFKKHAETPVLDRTTSELNFRAGPFVQYQDKKYKLLYVGGSAWMTNGSSVKPVYGIKMAQSEDGIHWNNAKSILEPDLVSEHGFGRPYLFNVSNQEYLSYSIRDIISNDYKLGLAILKDDNLTRIDDEIIILREGEKLLNRSLMYASFINYEDNLYMFYNTGDFGLDGIHLAIMKK